MTVTEESGTEDTGGKLVPFPGPRTAAEELTELELVDGTPPAARRPGKELEPAGPVYDAVIVDETKEPVQPTIKAIAERIAAPVKAVAHHEPTVATSKAVVRQAAYVFAGLGVVAKRAWDAKTNSPYARAMRAAEAAGDWDRWGDAEERGQRARAARHKRLMELVTLPWTLTKALLGAIALLAGVLLAAGVVYAFAAEDFSVVDDPLRTAATLIGWLVAAGVWLSWWLAILAPALAVGGLWHLGKQAEAAPRWLMSPRQVGPGDMMPSALTEDTITAALRGTVADFDRAVKGGWKVRYRIPPRGFEGGTHFQLELPPKAPVEAFVKNKTVLAHNLKRYPIEVWPTEPIAGVLDGWIADPGVLTKPVGPWPVLKDLANVRCDYFKGIPVAVTLRGQVVASPLGQKNYFMAGIMGSGKSSMAITLALGAILDPLVDVDVVVMAENGDYEPMRPALRSLHTGAEPDTVEAAIGLLRDRFRSLGELGELLREQMAVTQAQGGEPDKFICREYAEREPRLRPRVMIIDECQNLFMSEHGKDAEVIMKQLVTTARKYATTLILLTPDPTGDAIPTGIVRIMSNRACFPIGDQIGNDAAIGTGSHRTGLTAVNLMPAVDNEPNDAGTCAARGFTNPPGMLRCFYVPQSDAHRVTQRALELRAGRQKRLTAAPEVRDLLADVARVLGDRTDRVRAADVPRLLAAEFPGYEPYRLMKGTELAARLTAEGVFVPTTGNVFPVYPDRVREALRSRGA